MTLGHELDINLALQPNYRMDFYLESEETLNDSDKTITVPAGQIYWIEWIWVELTTDATVGARQLEVQFRDNAADVIGVIVPGVTQAASLTYNYMIGPALADHLGVRDGQYIMTPMPPTVFLTAEEDVRIFDNNVVSAAGDDMIIQMKVGRILV